MLRLLALSLVLLAACGGTTKPPAGTAWAPAFDATSTGWLMNVWADAPDHVLMAGGRPDAGLLMGFDGSAWAPVELPAEVPLLAWAFGFGPDDVTVVGEHGTVLHRDAEGWSREDTPVDEDLWGVWGPSPGDLWAVGGGGFPGNQPTVLRRVGGAWTAVDLPALQRANVFALYKVWGTAADDVFMVGQRGVALHWDGRALSEVLVGASDDIVSLWGARGHLMAVGGRSSAQVSTFDGTAWHTEVLAELPGLNGVWTRDGETFHVAGVDGNLLKIDFTSLQYQRTAIHTRDDFHSVFGVGDDLFAVGGSLGALSGPYRGLAYRRKLSSGE